MKQSFYYIFISIFMLFMVACEPDVQPELTFVKVDQEMIEPLYTSVEISCKLSSNLTIQYASAMLSTTEDFAESITVVLEKMTEDKYVGSTQSLAPATKYYVRYKVSNVYSSYTSENMAWFETFSVGMPIVYTVSVSDVTYTTAKVSAQLKEKLSENITQSGFCYSTSPMPTLVDGDKVLHTATGGVFTSYLKNLKEGTTYYVRAYAINDQGISYGRDLCFTTDIHTFHEGHEYIDLGLSVKWATANLGASSSGKYGDYYAWGETKTKTDYSWSSYKHGDSKSMTKYNCSANFGKVDNKTKLDLVDDAANVVWGGDWRMPTSNEVAELYKNCDWTCEDQGYRVTSKINGRSIFLAAGGCMTGTSIFKAGEHGYYWTSNYLEAEPSMVHVLYFNNQGYKDHTCPRYYGCFIRPVYPK